MSAALNVTKYVERADVLSGSMRPGDPAQSPPQVQCRRGPKLRRRRVAVYRRYLREGVEAELAKTKEEG